MQRLVQNIAEAVGGELRPQFAKRYRTFEKAVSEYANPGGAEHDPDDETPLGKAWRLLVEGKTDEANAAFDTLEAAAKTVEERAQVRFSRLIGGKETGIELLEKIEALDHDLKTTAEYRIWKGVLEPHPLIGIASLEHCVRELKPMTFDHRMATTVLARRYAEIGREADALRILGSALRSSDRHLREQAVERWLASFPTVDPTTKLFLLVIGLTARNNASFAHQAIDLTLDQSWLALLVRFAYKYDSDQETATSACQLGRALHVAKLPSLAFRAYSRASKQGVSVAKSNMASLMLAHPVPAAGLEILESHTGTFDSASPSFPHKIRGSIEEGIEEEQKRATALRTLGEKVYQQLALLADLTLSDAEETPARDDVHLTVVERYRAAGSPVNKIAAAIEGKETERVELVRTLPGFNVWTVTVAGGPGGFVHIRADGTFVGFRAPLSSADTAVTAIVGAAATASGEPAEPASRPSTATEASTSGNVA